MGVIMQAATRRNLALLGLSVAFLLLLWQVPASPGSTSGGIERLGTPQPTPTVETHWRPLIRLEGRGPRDLCLEGERITVPGPWRVRALPADRTVEVRIYDQHDGRLFARVWAAGLDRGGLATLPQGNGTFCLQIDAEGEYTLWVEAWEAP
jgi:hypothetical protein